MRRSELSAKEIVRAIAESTRDGAELIERMLEISRQKRDTPARATAAQIATVWLLERLGGKAPERVQVEHSQALTETEQEAIARLRGLSDEELEAREKLLLGS